MSQCSGCGMIICDCSGLRKREWFDFHEEGETQCPNCGDFGCTSQNCFDSCMQTNRLIWKVIIR